MQINIQNIKNLFLSEINQEISDHKALKPFTITEDYLKNLPGPVKKHFFKSALIGKNFTKNARIHWGDVYMKLKKNMDWIKMSRVLQFNSAPEPVRIINLKAKLAGFLPFEGRDKYHVGYGHMFIKAMRLFVVEDVKSFKMNDSALVTVLSEAFLLPGYVLQDYIQWDEINDRSAKATITHNETSVSGVFHFDENGLFKSFITHDRWQDDSNPEPIPWSVFVDDYKEINGILYPYKLHVIWHENEGDHEYFRGIINNVDFNIEKF